MPPPPPHDPFHEHRRTLAARLAAREHGIRRVRAVTGLALAAGVLATGAVAVIASGAPAGQSSSAGPADPAAVRQTALATRRARTADREEIAWERRVSREALLEMERERGEESLAGAGAPSGGVPSAITPQVQAPVPASVPPVVVSGGS